VRCGPKSARLASFQLPSLADEAQPGSPQVAEKRSAYRPYGRRTSLTRAGGIWRQHELEPSWGHWCHDLEMANGSLFEDVSDALRGLSPADLGELHCTHHRYGIKIWLGPATKAPREHYEAQVVGPQYIPKGARIGIEVGFHSEHPHEADNAAVIAALVRSEPRWRKQLGEEVLVGTFLGRAEHWRRVSEVWPDPDMSDPELVFELAARLTDYLTALEPCRTGGRKTTDR
jgi:hypothetical protein